MDIFDIKYLVFYSCHETGDRIDASKPYLTDKDSAISMALGMLRAPGDFFGLIDINKVTIQLYFEVSGSIWVEIPIEKAQGSYGKHISACEIESYLLSLPSIFDISCLPNAEFVSWR